MTPNIHDAPVRRTLSVWIAAVTAVVVAAAVLALTPTRAHAIATPVPLGTAASYGVLAGATVTNTGPTVVEGLNVGVSPGTAITGFFASDGGPGIVTPPGTLHSADAAAGQAKVDLTTAYNQAAGQTLTNAVYNDDPHEFGGQTLTAGLYRANSRAQITGTLTLDAQGDPSAVWVFQIGSTLTTAAENSTVSLVNGASPCNVYWQVGSSATLGTNTSFVGTILADTSITATTGATINGRLLADAGARGDGAVTLDSNRIFLGPCGTGGTTGGLVSGGVIAGATTGGTTTGTTTGTTGSTTVGAIAGVPTGGGTGGGTGGALGGLLGGVLTTGGTTGGVLGGLVAGTTTSGTTGATTGGVNGGVNGGAIGGPGHGHGGQPGKPGGHDHHGKPDEHGGHDHGEKPEEHGGYDGHDSEPGKDDGYADIRH
ncbi:ice-binding family protein [Streptomyces sp. ADMS]|uniref:ice-binding family protein n=1 Tax=Streptomyces sp. ADMS TaxID=3071415 RepID=UPI00296E32CE|nr:ice-binding family protein [Streptomyces sp. ADMS]MDW4907238.1 ice-binding family protein [Streptomyces sp. ADMS]